MEPETGNVGGKICLNKLGGTGQGGVGRGKYFVQLFVLMGELYDK